MSAAHSTTPAGAAGGREAAPVIGSRADLLDYTDRLLLAVRPFASPSHSLLTLPGTPGGYGTEVDGLEGFARTFLAVGFRIAGERGADPHGYLERYAAGLAAGTDPRHPERWVRPGEHGQAKVEAASLALVLDLTRPWLWDRLDPRVQENVVGYLADVVGDEDYPRSNWLWFRVTVETFLRSVGGPHSLTDIAEDLERHDSFYERDGWYRDGDPRNYDHYIGWAMHLYPTLWARMSGAADLAAPRAELDRERLDRYLIDSLRLLGADGGPLAQGRSLAYRFAAAAPYWVGAVAQVPSTPVGLLREAGLAVVNHFASRGVPNARGLLDLGWFGPWRPLAQSYSGTGSPYWASKGLLGLALPADHELWTAPAQPLPAATADHAFTIAAPVWAVSSTARDGIVRLANHGADHADPGDDGGDSPLYARLGYSTATFPLHRGQDWVAPVDQTLALVDSTGRRSHRSGMTPIVLHTEEGTALAASRADAHWLDLDAAQARHGSGLRGTPIPAGTVTTLSVLHGAWEVRLVHTADLSSAAVALECGGWPLADDAGVVVEVTAGAGTPDAVVPDGAASPRVDLASRGLTSAVIGLLGWAGAAVVHRNDASPLGAHAAVGVLSAPATPGWRAAAIGLTSADHRLDDVPVVTLTDSHAHVAWADGSATAVALPVAAAD